jgi:hypothetical protein
MNREGFLKLRNGLIEHVDGRQFTANDLGVYLFLHLHKNWRSGICWTNAAGVATTLDGSPHSSVKRSFERLRERHYIQYRKGDGSRANYPVLLINDEPTRGILKGCRLKGFIDLNFEVVEYEVSDGECLERIQKIAAVYPERGWCCDQSVSGAWLVRIPLPDLQDFKTFKTLPDVEEEKDLSRQASASVDLENPNPSTKDSEAHGTGEGNAPAPNGASAIDQCKSNPGTVFEAKCLCGKTEEDCNMSSSPCRERDARMAKHQIELKRRHFEEKWGREAMEHWIKVCRGCNAEFHNYGRPDNGFHSSDCYQAWREREDERMRAKASVMPQPGKRLAAFLDGE